MIETLADGSALTSSEIPPEHDPRVVDGVGTRRKRLAELSPVQRAALVLERYPELRALPNCDWERLSRQASFTILFGEASRHSARLQLAALAGVVASAGTSAAYAKELENAVRRVLDLLKQRFDITSPRAITRNSSSFLYRLPVSVVRRPEYMDRVDFFPDGYVKAADAHERMGDLAGARERHRLIAQLKQLRSEMLLPAEAEQQGTGTRT